MPLKKPIMIFTLGIIHFFQIKKKYLDLHKNILLEEKKTLTGILLLCKTNTFSNILFNANSIYKLSIWTLTKLREKKAQIKSLLSCWILRWQGHCNHTVQPSEQTQVTGVSGIHLSQVQQWHWTSAYLLAKHPIPI